MFPQSNSSNAAADLGAAVFRRGFELSETKLAHFKARIKAQPRMLRSNSTASTGTGAHRGSVVGVVELEDVPGQPFKLNLLGGTFNIYGGAMKPGTFWALRNLFVQVARDKTVQLSTINETTFAPIADDDDDAKQLKERFSPIEDAKRTVANILSSEKNRTVKATLRVHKVQIGAVTITRDPSTSGKLIASVSAAADTADAANRKERSTGNSGGCEDGDDAGAFAQFLSFVGCASCRTRLEVDAQDVPAACATPGCAAMLAAVNAQNVVCTPPMVLTVSDGGVGAAPSSPSSVLGDGDGNGDGGGGRGGGSRTDSTGRGGGGGGSERGPGSARVATGLLELQVGCFPSTNVGSALARDFLEGGLAHARKYRWDGMEGHRLGTGPLAEADAIFALCTRLLDPETEHTVDAVVSCRVRTDANGFLLANPSFALQSVASLRP